MPAPALAPANAAVVQHVVASIAASALDPLSEARLRAVADDPHAQLMATPRVGGGGALGSPEAVVRLANQNTSDCAVYAPPRVRATHRYYYLYLSSSFLSVNDRPSRINYTAAQQKSEEKTLRLPKTLKINLFYSHTLLQAEKCHMKM